MVREVPQSKQGIPMTLTEAFFAAVGLFALAAAQPWRWVESIAGFFIACLTIVMALFGVKK
jgi:divalent metal cation (Fe/Co/Zn/Cd) transporter